jgi:preprotein translocase subunit YajC
MDYIYFSMDVFHTTLSRIALFAQAVPPDAAPPAAEEVSFLTSFFGNPVNLLMLAVMLFFFIVIWPQQRQAKAAQQAHAKALADMKKNDRVVTSGGIHGTIIQANSDEPVIIIRIDDNTGARMTVNRDAVVKVTNES